MLPRLNKNLPKEMTKLARPLAAYLQENVHYTFAGFNFPATFLDLLLVSLVRSLCDRQKKCLAMGARRQPLVPNISLPARLGHISARRRRLLRDDALGVVGARSGGPFACLSVARPA